MGIPPPGPTLYTTFFCQVVKTMEAEAPGLIDVPEQHELVGAVGDHLNFRLKNASDEGNLSFQVCTYWHHQPRETVVALNNRVE